MNGDTDDSRWMDERDDEVQLGLTCHVELEVESGGTYREILAEAARALRVTAEQIEGGKLDTGFHPVRTPSGKEIRQVYLDYHGTGEIVRDE
jgi:hypothetical protein